MVSFRRFLLVHDSFFFLCLVKRPGATVPHVQRYPLCDLLVAAGARFSGLSELSCLFGFRHKNCRYVNTKIPKAAWDSKRFLRYVLCWKKERRHPRAVPVDRGVVPESCHLEKRGGQKGNTAFMGGGRLTLVVGVDYFLLSELRL